MGMNKMTQAIKCLVPQKQLNKHHSEQAKISQKGSQYLVFLAFQDDDI